MNPHGLHNYMASSSPLSLVSPGAGARELGSESTPGGAAARAMPAAADGAGGGGGGVFAAADCAAPLALLGAAVDECCGQ